MNDIGRVSAVKNKASAAHCVTSSIGMKLRFSSSGMRRGRESRKATMSGEMSSINTSICSFTRWFDCVLSQLTADRRGKKSVSTAESTSMLRYDERATALL